MIRGNRGSLSQRKVRARRVRKKITGTVECPRMTVFRSLKNMYVQIIDDTKGVTLLGVSSSGPDMKNKKIEGGKAGVAKELGKLVAEKAKEMGISRVVFDRAGYLYHGRIKAIADGAREGGLQF